MENKEQFSNRMGLILTALGMAIGAGNIWRFPRLAGEYGGTFLILWMFFLILWSIPIIMTEFAIGKKFKQSVYGSMKEFTGKHLAWMGFFITVCCSAIAFYYSVIVGWGIRYLGLAIENAYNVVVGNPSLEDSIKANPNFVNEHWKAIINADYFSLALHVLAVIIAYYVLNRGISKGLELANRIMIPTLFVLLIFTGLFTLSLDGAIKGLEYMYTIKPESFKDANVWLQALSHSAWSTGAGWGLILTISSYGKSNSDVTLNSSIIGFGDNTASILAAMTILPAVFGLAATPEEAVAYLQSGNAGLTFNVIPALFTKIHGGAFLSIIFFAAFVLAAFSSLLPMMELIIKTLTDIGITRHTATIRTTLICIFLGLPSAYNNKIFENQDWVWGVGLIVSGFLFMSAVFIYGIDKFKHELIDPDSDIYVPDWLFKLCIVINIFLAVILVAWWMRQGYSKNPWFEDGSWNWIDMYSNATIITQWLIVFAVGIVLNNYLTKRFNKGA